MSAPEPVVVQSLADQPLNPSQPVIYDRPIASRLLYRDPVGGAEHFLIRYPEGLQARRHRHSAAHTIVVLDGALTVSGQVLGPARTATSRRASPCTTLPHRGARACS
jgi:quercetin dioxygenase-like cupin family protein